VWRAPDAAVERYLAVASDLHAGRTPRKVSSGELTVKDACNAFLAWQKEKMDAGEIGSRWFEDCRSILVAFAEALGKSRLVSDLRPEDFQRYRSSLAKKLGVHALTRQVTTIKSMFRHAYETDQIERPVKFGKWFAKPSVAQERKAKSRSEPANGPRLFTSGEIKAILNSTEGWLKAAVLLGVNGGMGNTDCATLPRSAVDLSRGVIEYPRPKTGVVRVIPLWPETVKELTGVVHNHPRPASDMATRLVFLTSRGNPMVRQTIRQHEDGTLRVSNADEISLRFAQVLDGLKIRRTGVGFYSLRHTFRTWADEVHDQHAIHRITGHASPGMSGIYVEEISLNRLQAVVDHVRAKLFATQ